LIDGFDQISLVIERKCIEENSRTEEYNWFIRSLKLPITKVDNIKLIKKNVGQSAKRPNKQNRPKT